jgi:hypothetical protein
MPVRLTVSFAVAFESHREDEIRTLFYPSFLISISTVAKDTLCDVYKARTLLFYKQNEKPAEFSAGSL